MQPCAAFAKTGTKMSLNLHFQNNVGNFNT